jgi:uncharacterized membrane protein YhaH (DUF805 family)
MMSTTLLVLVFFAFWIAAFVHCLTNRRLTDIQKLAWVLVIFVLNMLGAVIYFAVGRNPRV